jgi:hypothetical protein
MNKRILKTGALAAAVTVGFGIFAYRAAEWSKGLNSEMIVLGQGTATAGSNPCATGGTGTTTAQTTRVIPQMAMGLFNGGLAYTTIVQIVNTSGAPQSISANFYKQDGSPLNNISLTAGASTITDGMLSTVSIPKDGILVINGGGTGNAGVVGWGKITSCGGLSISTFFELRDAANNVLYSRVGVPASPANMSGFIIPRVRDLAAGLDVGFALVNTGAPGTSATVRAELRNAAGTVIKFMDIEMAGGSQRALFTRDLFAPLDETTGRNYQYVKFSSSSPTFAAIALAFEGGTQTSFPVDVLQ